MTYDLNLEYQTYSNRLVKIDLLEGTQYSPQGLEKTIYPVIVNNPSDPFLYQMKIPYTPGTYAKSAQLRFCIEGTQDLPTSFDLEPIQVSESYPNYLVFLTQEHPSIDRPGYNLQFVALNQTAYLVQVSNVSSPFVLGFNSRFDEQWEVRAVDPSTAKAYFAGSQKAYLGGKVLEYQRQDQHLLTELVFATSSARSPDIVLNAYGNGWLVNTPDQKESAYLIEYKPQQVLYKTSAISLLSLLGLGVIYILWYFSKTKAHLGQK